MIYLNGQLKDSHNLTGTVKAGQIATIGKTGGVYFKERSITYRLTAGVE